MVFNENSMQNFVPLKSNALSQKTSNDSLWFLMRSKMKICVLLKSNALSETNFDLGTYNK